MKTTSIEKTKAELAVLMRYTVVGVFAYLVNLAVLFILTEWFGVHYLISSLVGYIAIVAVSYLLSVKWVFLIRKVKSHRREFFAFAFITVGAMIINTGVMWLFTDVCGWHYIISNIVTNILATAWGYVPKKVFLFSEGKHGSEEPETYSFEE